MVSRAVHYRTEYCKFYQIGTCARGNSCAFAHTTEEVMPKVNLVKTALCHSFSISGSCRRGSRCKFAHGEDELQPLDESFSARTSNPQLQKEGEQSVEEWLESGIVSANMAMGTQSARSGNYKSQAMAKPQQQRATGKETAPGYSHDPPPDIDSQTTELEHLALETRNLISAGTAQSLLNGQTNVKSLKFRTNLCKFYFAGRCSRGMDCTFAHSKENLLPVVDLRKGSLCFNFAQGYCKEGDDCKFAHGKSNLRQPSLRQAPELDCMPMPTQLQVSPSLLYSDDSMSESTTASLTSHGLEDITSFGSFECFGTLRL